MVYLDNHSTTKPLSEVVDVIKSALEDDWSNPNSTHRSAQLVRGKVEAARASIGKLINSLPKDIIFTSGGTEGANWPIYAALSGSVRPMDIVTSFIEHPAVLDAASSLAMKIQGTHHQLSISSNGVINPNELKEVIANAVNPISLVSIMWVNNLTGIIQPIYEIGKICKENGIPFHVDGSQWVGKMPVDISQFPGDYLTMSAHKFHGPKGIGALWVRPGSPVTQVMMGGSQERGRRGGTENVPGILGFGIASEHAFNFFTKTDFEKELLENRDYFESQILKSFSDAFIAGERSTRIWSCSCISFSKVDPDLFLLYLSESGIASTAGAACASGSFVEPLPVSLMREAGADVPDNVATIRFSFNRFQTRAEISKALKLIVKAAERASLATST